MEKHTNGNDNTGQADIDQQKSFDEDLAEQKRNDALRELENMRKWVDEDVRPPVKLSCKISKHIVSDKCNDDR